VARLQSALEKCYNTSVPFSVIIHQATGFTHQRRIELMQRIAAAPASINELAGKTVMSYAALSRHLRKLEARHYLALCDGRYTVGKPAGHLAKALSAIITG
jgi:DNA-binding MarR family transcriptional regulator